MFLALLVVAIATAAADPFHKYPYMFLLDIGNEEIEGAATEQLRVTIPGGSLALKYPAVDTGDLISHVRVSGVDFGTDLKAEIVEGGPGYSYVVLVFMGNPGVAYDAVVTIETVGNDTNAVESNDSAEDTDSKDIDSETADIDSSSNIYVNDGNNDLANQEYEDPQIDNGGSENEYSDIPQQNLDKERYEKYQAFRPQLYGGARIYPQASLYVEDNNFKPLYDPENHAEDNVNLDSNNNNAEYNSVSADY